MADELKQPPLPFEVLPPLGEKEKDEEKEPLPFEVLPPNRMPTSTSFGRSLGLRPIEEVLPEEAPAPKRELATSPVIEEMKAKVEAEVEQGGIWKLRDEADEVSKQFQAIRAEQVEAEAMKLPTGAMRDRRSLLLEEWNKKNAELQARRAAFEEKTGFTPDEYGRSEREIKLLREQGGERERIRGLEEMKRYGDAGTIGHYGYGEDKAGKQTFLRDFNVAAEMIRDEALPTMLFGPSVRRFEEDRPNKGILPWRKGIGEAFWEDWNSQPKDRNKGMKILDGVVAAVFEGTPKTPWHAVAQDGMDAADESSASVDKKYGKDSWEAQYWGATMGVTKTLLGFSDVMFGNVGGLATLGAGGALAKTAQAARGTAAGTAAAAAAATGEAALAVHIAGQIQLSLPSVLDTMYDPKASIKEKSEALSGTVLAAFFVVKLGKNSAKTLEGALKSQYGVDINLETATRAELNNAGVRIVRVRENRAAKAEGREPITPKEGETLTEYATRVAARVTLPKLKGEHQRTFNRKVGELQALDRMRLEERKSGEEIPVEETTIVEPILGERPARPLLEAEPQPIVVPPEVLKFEPEPVDRRADAPEAGSVEAYYGERGTLQVQPKEVAGVRQPAWTAAEAVEGKIPNAFYGTPKMEIESGLKLDLGSEKLMRGPTGETAQGVGRYATSRRSQAEHFATSRGKKVKDYLIYEYDLNISKDAILYRDGKRGGIKLQPKVVQEAWKDFVERLEKNPTKNERQLNLIYEYGDSWNGGHLYGQLVDYFGAEAKMKAGKWTDEAIYVGQTRASKYLRDKGVDALSYQRGEREDLSSNRVEGTYPAYVILNTSKARIVSVKNKAGEELLKDKAPFAFAPDKPTAPKEPVVEPVDPTDPRVMEMVERLRETRGRELEKPTPEEVIREEVAAEEKVDASTLEAKTDVADELIRLHEEMGVAPPDKAILDALREEPAKPAAKAAAEVVVEDAKVVEATEKVVEAEAATEAAAEIAVIASRMPDMGVKMKKLVERHVDFLRKDGATAEELGMAAELEADPSSFYEMYPTSEWAQKLTKYTEAEVNVLNESLKALKEPPEALRGLVEGVLVDHKYRAWKKAREAKSKESGNLEKEYRDALQAWSNEGTKKGQWIQAQRYNPHRSPEVALDAIQHRIESSVGGKKLTPKQSGELLELIEKSQDTLKEFQELQREYHRDPTEPTGKAFDAAYESMVKAEAAARAQWEFLRDHEPQLWADIYVSILQGNLLTPATLVLNPVGNIVPLPFRAGSRTAARVVDLIDEFLLTPSTPWIGRGSAGTAKLKKLRAELKGFDKSEPAHGEILAEIAEVKAGIKASETTVRAGRLKLEALREELKGLDKSDPAYIEKMAEIARLEKETMGEAVLQPLRGSGAKLRGFAKGLGWDRLTESLNAFKEAPKGEGRAAFMGAFKHRRYADALSTFFYGQKVNIYEARPELAMTPLSPGKALARLYRSVSSKEGRLGAEGFVKNLAVGIGGPFPNLIFRLLGMGDLPFRQAEMYRVIENYAERLAKAKGWNKKQQDLYIARARKAPELVFTEKQLEYFENEGAKASFQNETWATRVLSWANVGMRGPKRKGALGAAGRGVYMGYRTVTPYQKTLMNIFGELGGATPLGMVEAFNPYLNRAQKKYAIGRAAFGTGLYLAIQAIRDATNENIISVDYSTGMTTERKASIRYLSNKHKAHGTLNMSAAKRFWNTGDSGGTQVGDNIIDLQKAGPIGDIMLANAAWGDLMETLPPKERKGVEDNWYKMLASHAYQSAKYKSRYLLNQSFAQNARDVAQSIFRGDDPQQWAKPFARALPALAIPNTLDWLYGHSADNRWLRNYRSDDGAVGELKQVWKKKMEAMGWATSDGKWSEQAEGRNPLIFDMWGQPVERVREGATLLGMKKVNLASSLERYALSGFAVLQQGEVPNNPAARVIWGLWKATRDSELVPPIPRRDISREGVNYKLNRDQYAVYQRLVGLRRMKGPPAPPRRARWPSGTEKVLGTSWAGMDALIGLTGQQKTGNHYKGGTTNFEDLTEEEQVKEIKRTYDGASRSAGDYLVKNFMLDKPTPPNLLALAGVDLSKPWDSMTPKEQADAEKEARAVIKGFSINLDNLDKLEVTEKPSGRLKK